MKPQLFIGALTLGHAQHWAEEHGLLRHEWRYISRPHELRGYQKLRYKLLPSFCDRRDAAEIVDTLALLSNVGVAAPWDFADRQAGA